MVTPRQAHRLIRQFNAGMNDPMTRHYGAGEFVAQSFNDKLRKMRISEQQLNDLDKQYINKRLRFKDPARLQWKAEDGHRRMFETVGEEW